jgi:hypothetical protein
MFTAENSAVHYPAVISLEAPSRVSRMIIRVRRHSRKTGNSVPKKCTIGFMLAVLVVAGLSWWNHEFVSPKSSTSDISTIA